MPTSSTNTGKQPKQNTVQSTAYAQAKLTTDQQAAINKFFGPLVENNKKALKKINEGFAGTTAVGLNRLTTAFIKAVKIADEKTEKVFEGTGTEIGRAHV